MTATITTEKLGETVGAEVPGVDVDRLLNDEALRVWTLALRPAEPRHPLPRQDDGRPKGLNALGTLARHPELTPSLQHVQRPILFTSTLTPRRRELLVLRVRRGAAGDIRVGAARGARR